MRDTGSEYRVRLRIFTRKRIEQRFKYKIKINMIYLYVLTYLKKVESHVIRKIQ